jgi:hypothetical protein
MPVRLNGGDSVDPYRDGVTLSLSKENPSSNEPANSHSTEERKVFQGDYLEESRERMAHIEISIHERKRMVLSRIINEERWDEANLTVQPAGQQRHDSEESRPLTGVISSNLLLTSTHPCSNVWCPNLLSCPAKVEITSLDSL